MTFVEPGVPSAAGRHNLHSVRTSKLTAMRLLAGASLVCGALVYASAAGASGISRTATTRTYALRLAVGPSEAMYTAAQVKATHPRASAKAGRISTTATTSPW